MMQEIDTWKCNITDRRTDESTNINNKRFLLGLVFVWKMIIIVNVMNTQTHKLALWFESEISFSSLYYILISWINIFIFLNLYLILLEILCSFFCAQHREQSYKPNRDQHSSCRQIRNECIQMCSIFIFYCHRLLTSSVNVAHLTRRLDRSIELFENFQNLTFSRMVLEVISSRHGLINFDFSRNLYFHR